MKQKKQSEPQPWNKAINNVINVPDELDPIINKVGMQIKMFRISGKSENQTICDIVYAAEQFFKNLYCKPVEPDNALIQQEK